jgi:hypothetical protein
MSITLCQKVSTCKLQVKKGENCSLFWKIRVLDSHHLKNRPLAITSGVLRNTVESCPHLATSILHRRKWPQPRFAKIQDSGCRFVGNRQQVLTTAVNDQPSRNVGRCLSPCETKLYAHYHQLENAWVNHKVSCSVHGHNTLLFHLLPEMLLILNVRRTFSLHQCL